MRPPSPVDQDVDMTNASPLRVVLRSGPLWESAGRTLVPGLAGVTLTEAAKDLYAAVPATARPARRLVFAEAV